METSAWMWNLVLVPESLFEAAVVRSQATEFWPWLAALRPLWC